MKGVHEVSSTMGEKRPRTNPISVMNTGIMKGLRASREGEKWFFFGHTERITNPIAFYLLSNETS